MTDPTPAQSDAASAPRGAQVQLLELGAHFALAERAAHMGYWRQEIGSAAPHWSPGFFAIMGLDPDGVRPSTEYMAKRIHPDERVMVAQKIAEALTTGQPFHYRTQTWYGGGPVRYYDTHGDVERGCDGQITALLGVVREVTEEVEANRRLQESESTYRFMTDEATDIITRHGPQGVPVFISPAIEQILGYKPGEILGTLPFQRAHPDDLEMARASIMEAKATGRTVSYTHRSRHKLGHYVWLESRVRFVSNPVTGERDTAISVTRDISTRKQFEEDLLRAREKAEAASHTKSRFLANMSHELRTPLNAIIGFSDIISREMFGPLGNARYVEYIKLIHESGGMLLDLINDLLDMSKIEAGKYELHIEDFLVRDAVDASLQLFAARAGEKDIRLAARVEPENMCVRADRRAFKQIMLNLVSNAIKFTNTGGEITVEAVETAAGMRFCVRDSGIGIPAEFLPRVAQPFEQASNDPSRTHGGSGLGLALVKSLAQLHGGEFLIESEVGRGTSVTVTLPLVPLAQSSVA